MSIPCTADFKLAAAQKKLYVPIFEVAVLDPTGGSALFRVDPATFSVTRDRTRAIRGTCDFSLHGNLSSLVPPGTDPRIMLPWGTEVRLSRGYEYLDGSQELLTRVTCRLTTTDLSDMPDEGVSTRFAGSDRAERLDREGVTPFDASPGQRYDDVIVRYLQQAWRGAATTSVSMPKFSIAGTADDPGGPHLTPLLHFEAKSHAWTEAQKMASAIARELYVLPDGAVTLRELPDRLAAPDWQFVDGEYDTRISLARSYSSDSTPNYWTVNGTGPGATSGSAGIFGVAYVDDPSTSLDISGQYGTVPRWIDSVYSTTKQMCEAEARAERSKVLAGTDTIVIETIPIPHLLEGDVVNVSAASIEIQDGHYVIASIEETMNSMRITAGRG